MANPKDLALLRQGVEVWNRQWFRNTYVPDLSGADLRAANLRGISLFQPDLDNYGAELDGINLIDSDLEFADFRRARMNKAQLRYADCSHARFDGASLEGADLRGALLYQTLFGPEPTMLFDVFAPAKLSNANLGGARLDAVTFRDTLLDGTIFKDATIGGVFFIGVDLSRTEGLSTIIHERPSVIDIGTLYRSRGTIPEEFLRGCGFPESLGIFQRSLTGQNGAPSG